MMQPRAEVRRGPLNDSQLHEWWRTQTGAASSVVVRQTVEPPAPKDRVLELIRQVVDRHEALRSTIELDCDGQPCQIVWSPGEPVTPAFETIGPPSERQLEYIFGTELLETPEPISVCLSLDERGHVLELFLVASHVLLDGAGTMVVGRDLSGLLAGSPVPRHPAPQPLDATVTADAARSPRHEQRTVEHWTEKYRSAPSSLFPATDRDPREIFSGTLESASGPAVLAAAVRRHRCSPAVLYLAMVHVVLSAMSGHGVVSVNTHFHGRGPDDEATAGCFHRLLLTVVDLSDRPPLSEVLRRVEREQFRAMMRHQVQWNALERIRCQEVKRRGTEFSQGSTVNFSVDPHYPRWAEAFSASGCVPSAPDVSVQLNPAQSISGNPAGLDAYLGVTLSPTLLLVRGGFGPATLRENEMSALLREPELILMDSLGADDLSFAEIAHRIAARNSLEPRSATWARGRLFDRPRAESILALHPDVVSALVVCEGRGEPANVRAFVETRDPFLTASALRVHFLAHLSRSAPVACPDEFLLTSMSPGDRDDVESWRGLEILARGSGTDLPRVAALSDAEKLLVAAAEKFNEAGFGDVSSTYLDAGGLLTAVPAVLRELERLGCSGLRPEDFTRPLPLSSLAAALR